MTRSSSIQSLVARPPSVRTPAQSGAEARREHLPLEFAAAAAPLDLAGERRAERLGSRLGGWIETLQAGDLEAVRIISRTARWPAARLFAIVVSKLGNGWFYLILAAAIFARWGLRGTRMMVLAGVNAAVVHILYPRIKRRCRRARPFKVDPELSSLLATLDEHSFPSGHAMTLSAVLAPIVMLWPAMAISGALMVFCLAWSRIATAHHYPSDVLAGAMLGLGLGYPMSSALLSLW